MDELMARTMVEALSKGFDPLTGRVLPDDHVCANEDVQEALTIVLNHCTIESNEQLLKRLREERQEELRTRKNEAKSRYTNYGALWTSEEEQRVVKLNSQFNIWHIASIVGRSPKAIQSKLKQLGHKPNKKRNSSESKAPLSHLLVAKEIKRSNSDGLQRSQEPFTESPPRAGMPWTQKEEQALLQMYDDGVPSKEICSYFKRTEGAIAARLVRLGKIQNRDEFRYRK